MRQQVVKKHTLIGGLENTPVFIKAKLLATTFGRHSLIFIAQRHQTALIYRQLLQCYNNICYLRYLVTFRQT